MKVSIYLSKIYSVSHLIYAGAYINKILKDPSVTALYLYCFGIGKTFIGEAKICKEDFFVFLPKDSDVKKTYFLDEDAAVFFKSDLVIYLSRDAFGFNTDLLKIFIKHPFQKIKCVFVDEGIGSYKSKLERFKFLFYDRNPSKFIAIARILKEIVLNLIFRPQSWLLYENINNKWFVNQDIVDWFNIGLPLLDYKKIEKKDSIVYFLSQPYVEKKAVSENEYIDFLVQVEILLKKYGYNLLIKPHPAESKDKFSAFKIDDLSYPVEVRNDLKNCAAILGFRSTPLIHFSSIYQCSVFRFSQEGFKFGTNKASSMQNSLFEQYVTQIESMIAFEEILKNRFN